MVQWPILNNSHAYPFCETMPGSTSYLDLAIAPFLSVKLAEIGRETIKSVKVRVNQFVWQLGRQVRAFISRKLSVHDKNPVFSNNA